MANNLPIEKKVTAVSMLAEGTSIRSIERITGIHRDTVMRLGVSHREGKDDSGERFVAVLEIPPIVSPEAAVRAQIVKDVKTGYSK